MNYLLTIEALAQILPAVASLVHTIEEAFPGHSATQKVDHVLTTVQAAVGAAQTADAAYEQLKPVLAATVTSVVNANAANAATQPAPQPPEQPASFPSPASN